MPKTVADTLKRIDLSKVIDLAIQEARGCNELRGCTVVANGSPVTAEVLPMAMQNALVNLIINAAEAKKRCKVVVKLEDAGDAIHISVHDDGPGIPVAERSNVFLPHVTSKEYNQGMGLVAVECIARLHGGSVDIADSEYGGACVRITLPKSA